ncbi:MAG: hypothetical protein AMS21_00830 [Gemmatimonas sp. SG8_38_2]|nr:MAG: hypothetical protein AMS21_00830 [Gemmatimonas sp. SG8_38_2]
MPFDYWGTLMSFGRTAIQDPVETVATVGRVALAVGEETAKQAVVSIGKQIYPAAGTGNLAETTIMTSKAMIEQPAAEGESLKQMYDKIEQNVSGALKVAETTARLIFANPEVGAKVAMATQVEPTERVVGQIVKKAEEKATEVVKGVVKKLIGETATPVLPWIIAAIIAIVIIRGKTRG